MTSQRYWLPDEFNDIERLAGRSNQPTPVAHVIAASMEALPVFSTD